MSNWLLSIRRTADIAPFTLRQIRPDDAGALQNFCVPCRRRRVALRFHAALNELSESTLKALTCVDQRGHVAFVLTVTARGTERIVGEARYAVSSDRETAEFGIVVADAFRGLGAGGAAGGSADRRSSRHGLRWLVGEVLAGNSGMLAFMRRCGFAVTTRGVEPGIIRVERGVDRSLPGAPAAG